MMMIADFQMKDKANKPRFFQKIFLVADIKFEFGNVDISFNEETLT